MKTVILNSKGTHVVALQAILRSQGFVGQDGKPLSIDGHAGDNTIFAINAYQKMLRAYDIECGTNGHNDSSCGSKMWECLLGGDC
jgi:hypothetical protein